MAPALELPVQAGAFTDVIDADFEVLPRRPDVSSKADTPPPAGPAAPPLDGMAMLRPDNATRRFAVRGGPLFWTAGLCAALAAFWIAGGHVLVRQLAPSGKAAGSALGIAGVTSRVDRSGEKPVLLVDGEAGNDGAVATSLPPLEIRVTGEDGSVTRYRLGTSGRNLAPGERLAFSSRVDVPRNGVAAVAVRFAE